MTHQSKVCQGERNLDDHSQKVVTHRFNYQRRDTENDYEQGVSVELCPLFDFSVEPWMLLRHLIRQLTLSHLVTYYTEITKKPVSVKVLDVACGYAEIWTLLSRQMKAKGAKLQYIGVDIDEDKKIIAHQLRPSVDYRIMDMLDIESLPECPFDVIVCGETIEHVEEEKGIEFFKTMVRSLASGGYLIMSVPTPESETHRDNPFHLKLWTLDEIYGLGLEEELDFIDGFHLGIPMSDWPSHTKEAERRIPRELCRAFASAEVGDKFVGPNFIYVGRKP